MTANLIFCDSKGNDIVSGICLYLDDKYLENDFIIEVHAKYDYEKKRYEVSYDGYLPEFKYVEFDSHDDFVLFADMMRYFHIDVLNDKIECDKMYSVHMNYITKSYVAVDLK